MLQNYAHAFFKDLASLLTGRLVLPDDGTYEQVRQIWNGGVTTRPVAFVRWVRSHELALSVRGVVLQEES